MCIPVRTGLAALAFDLKDAQAKKVLTDERNNPRVQKKAALVGFGAGPTLTHSSRARGGGR